MSCALKKSVYWVLAVIITLVLSIYQRMTGPTYPKKVTVELNGESCKVKLPRSGVQKDEIVTLGSNLVPPYSSTPAPSVLLHYRRYPLADEYTTVDFRWKDHEWQAVLPVQPVGGKLQYYITVGEKDYPADGPILIRFRNDVPASILVPHILFMFAAILFAVYTFLLVLTRKAYSRWLKITVGTLFVGGFILGPLVQHVAFGPWWAGLPYLKWKYNKWVVCLAVLFMIAIFTVPHSAYGSEYDYTTQQLGTGKN